MKGLKGLKSYWKAVEKSPVCVCLCVFLCLCVCVVRSTVAPYAKILAKIGNLLILTVWVENKALINFQIGSYSFQGWLFFVTSKVEYPILNINHFQNYISPGVNVVSRPQKDAEGGIHLNWVNESLDMKKTTRRWSVTPEL